MEELLLEKEQLEEKLYKINKKIIKINIVNELNKLRVLCDVITNENFQKGLDYIYLANILGMHNHRGKGYMILFGMGIDKLNMDRDKLENINALYEEWLGLEYFEDIEDEFNLANRIRRYGEPEDEYVINRP